jgi:hypothetical protein
MREYAERHPALFIGTAAGLPFGVFLGLFIAISGDGRTPWLLIAALSVLAALIFGSLFGWAMARQQRELGGPAIARSVRKALRSRTLPETFGDEWLAGLDYRKRQASQYRWATPVVFLFLAMLGVGTITGSLFPDWVGWTEIVVFVVFAVVTLLSSNRELRAIAELERQLPQRV